MISVVNVLRKLAESVEKHAMPFEMTLDHKDIDFHFEMLDTESRKLVLEDFTQGKDIRFPELIIDGNEIPARVLSKHDFDEKGYEEIVRQMTQSLSQPPQNVRLTYDPDQRLYMHREAKAGVSYSCGSSQIDLPQDLAQEIMCWGKANVPDKDLYTKEADQGRENEIHVTLFYGITEDNQDKIYTLLFGLNPFECRLGLVTAFKDNKDHDVLKIDVESPELVKLHYMIGDSVKNKNKYPTYQGHVTIAYVKKGKADKFIGEDRFRGRTFKATEVTLSSKDHNKTKIPLGI